MKLIREDILSYKVLKEEVQGIRNYYIEGIWIQCDVKNKNGRNYPKTNVKPEIDRYINECINKNRAFGELGHAQQESATVINPERISHKIIKLVEDGSNWLGKAKILDTPYGKIAKNLLDEDCQLGVSLRALGSIEESSGTVLNDLHLITAGDIVTDPSAPDAFVRGIMEGREWVWSNGIVKEKVIADTKKIITNTPARKLPKVTVEQFQKFLDELAK